MAIIADNIAALKKNLLKGVELIAVSKTKPIEAIQDAYDGGQRIFGENKAQELSEKFESLPKDIEWHMIGHMQRNKVKYIAPFISLIHSVDSLRLLEEINKRAAQNNRKIACLLQAFIAKEETKFGFDLSELEDLGYSDLQSQFPNIIFKGLMGMASNVSDKNQVKNEFSSLRDRFDAMKNTFEDFEVLSMGMSGDYEIAIEVGSTHIRIGSALFGSR
jgi:pyridoxal phosphate enzyme (YggS family)